MVDIEKIKEEVLKLKSYIKSKCHLFLFVVSFYNCLFLEEKRDTDMKEVIFKKVYDELKEELNL